MDIATEIKVGGRRTRTGDWERERTGDQFRMIRKRKAITDLCN